VKQFISKRYFPHILAVIEATLVLIGLANMEKHVHFSTCLLLLGLVIHNLIGVTILITKKFYFGFREMNGTLAIIYGAIWIVVGFTLLVLFIYNSVT
jgi:hypothetical protein